MHIIVYGIGSVGGFYSSLIAEAISLGAHHRLSLIARPRIIKAINENGYIELRTVITGGDTTSLKVDKKYFNLVTSYAELEINPEEEKLVMLCVKSKDSVHCAEDIKTKFDNKTVVLSVQNGVSNEERIESVLGKGSVLGCLTNVASETVESGIYIQIYNPVNLYRLQFGELRAEQSSSRVEKIHQVLVDMGLTAKTSDEIIKDQWSKLVWNSAFNPLSALYRADLGGITSHPQAREEALGIMNETTRVANALGITLDVDLPNKHWELTNRKEWASFRTSMLQDLDAGKDIEIDELLGLIVDKGLEVGVPTPYAKRVFDALSKSLIIFLLFLSGFFAGIFQDLKATEVPANVKSAIQKLYPEAKFRYDGILETKNKQWLLLINPKGDENAEIEDLEQSPDGDLLFGNSYIYTPIENNTIKGYSEYAPLIKDRILSFVIPSDFLIPKGFSLPRDLGVLSDELPIPLRNSQLSTVKELELKTLLAAERVKEIRFLAYSSLDNGFALIKLAKNAENPASVEELKADKDLVWISKINKTKKNILLADYSTAKIYELDSDFKADSFKFKELADLKPFIHENGLLDFDLEHKTIYALSQKDSKIYAINTSNKKIISEIQLSNLVTEMEPFDFSSNTAKLLVVNSRGANEISFIDTSNYQVAQILKYKKGDEQNIIFDFVINKDLLVTASEYIKDENIKGKVNVYSSISKELKQSYDLDYIPQKVSFIDDGRMILILGFNKAKESFLTKIDLKTKEVLLQKSLGADVLSARIFAFNRDESLLVIPSLENKIISVIDLKNLELLKKIETETVYDKLIAL
ncbi:MAG: 2-dehydropantoate 2-reductase [Cyanobacteria bacterium REEB446]|nr:2-dehydropantoate 2-reductase [Cyanobacteria bacterium REEB446]